MDKYFADTDIIIDFLADREPHTVYSSRLFELAERGKIEIWISSLSINNIYYITRKISGNRKALDIINSLVEIVQIQNVGREEIIEALNSDFKDFEDALQYFCSLKIEGIKALLTRNTKDYKTAQLAVLTPKDLLKTGKL
ncbi:MAG: PIN domain-containing protein [Balneolaceae bacterium]